MCYAAQHERLRELESLARAGYLRLFYGDESYVCSEGYVPYGWQFPGEDVFVVAQKGVSPQLLGALWPR